MRICETGRKNSDAAIDGSYETGQKSSMAACDKSDDAGRRSSAAGMIDFDRVRRLAAAAKIWLSDEEAVEIAKDLTRWYESASLVLNAEAGTAAGAEGGVYERATVSMSALREDEPSPKFDAESVFKQVPSDGDGFIIPRLLE